MEVLLAVIPIFVVISMGFSARQKGFITDEFLESANRLVYCFSIPALIFGAIAKISFHQNFDYRVVSLTLLAILLVYLLSYLITNITGMNDAQSGAFILCSAHSNVGYLGLPIAYYYLDAASFAAAGIICGFMMILHNLLSVIFLQIKSPGQQQAVKGVILVRALAANPVIWGALAGMFVSILNIEMPRVIWRIIDILGGLAPPMALLLIGASLSLRIAGKSLAATLGAVFIKLVILPAFAVILFLLFRIESRIFLPAVILLSSPTATIVYVLVKGAHSDTDFAVRQISLGTMLSAFTIFLWLTIIPLFTMGGKM